MTGVLLFVRFVTNSCHLPLARSRYFKTFRITYQRIDIQTTCPLPKVAIGKLVVAMPVRQVSLNASYAAGAVTDGTESWVAWVTGFRGEPAVSVSRT